MDPCPSECKIVVVGDPRCGKTSLVHRVLHDAFLDVYVPTGFERYAALYDMGTHRVNFTVWDTAGSSAYDSVRPLAYQGANVFLLCFQIGRPDSIDNAINKWLPEVRHHAPNVPVVLCGCQSDARTELSNGGGSRPVTSEAAVEASHAMGACTYVETSAAASAASAREAFEVAALAALGRLNKNHATHRSVAVRSRSCAVM